MIICLFIPLCTMVLLFGVRPLAHFCFIESRSSCALCVICTFSDWPKRILESVSCYVRLEDMTLQIVFVSVFLATCVERFKIYSEIG